MDKDTYKKIRNEDMAYERAFRRDEYKGRSADARGRIERRLQIRRLKESGEDIYWDRIH